MKIIRYFYMKSLRSGVSFTLTAYFNLDDKFSPEILDLHLDFIKFAVENVDLHFSSCSQYT